jgi:hypothetical protein
MTKKFYKFSEDEDTVYGAHLSFNEAAAEIDPEDDYSSVLVTDENDIIIEVHRYSAGAFDNDTDSPYMGMDIDEVG